MKKYKRAFLLTVITLITVGYCGSKACVDIPDIESYSFESDTPQPESASLAVPEPTPSPTSKPTPTPEPEVVSLTVSAAGDVSLGILQIHGYAGTFREMYDLQGPAYFFQNVRDIFEKDDMTIVNFEGVLTESTDLVEKEYNIKGDPSYIEILPLGSIEGPSASATITAWITDSRGVMTLWLCLRKIIFPRLTMIRLASMRLRAFESVSSL